jgi:hypothetical protein
LDKSKTDNWFSGNLPAVSINTGRLLGPLLVLNEIKDISCGNFLKILCEHDIKFIPLFG